MANAKRGVQNKQKRQAIAPFSAKVEYACVAMLELALRYGDPQPVRLRAITDAHALSSQRFLVQVLLQLKAAGLVVSTRGASGGYHLARPPEKISLADIVDVLGRGDGESAPRITKDHAPMSPAVQAIRGVSHDILVAQQRILQTTTLADLVQRSQQNFDLMYQI